MNAAQLHVEQNLGCRACYATPGIAINSVIAIDAHEILIGKTNDPPARIRWLPRGALFVQNAKLSSPTYAPAMLDGSESFISASATCDDADRISNEESQTKVLFGPSQPRSIAAASELAVTEISHDQRHAPGQEGRYFQIRVLGVLWVVCPQNLEANNTCATTFERASMQLTPTRFDDQRADIPPIVCCDSDEAADESVNWGQKSAAPSLRPLRSAL